MKFPPSRKLGGFFMPSELDANARLGKKTA